MTPPKLTPPKWCRWLRIGKGYFIVVHPLRLAKVITQVSIDKLRIAMRRSSVDFVLRINGSCIFDLRLLAVLLAEVMMIILIRHIWL